MCINVVDHSTRTLNMMQHRLRITNCPASCSGGSRPLIAGRLSLQRLGVHLPLNRPVWDFNPRPPASEPTLLTIELLGQLMRTVLGGPLSVRPIHEARIWNLRASTICHTLDCEGWKSWVQRKIPRRSDSEDSWFTGRPQTTVIFMRYE